MKLTIGWHIESDDEGSIVIIRQRRHIRAGIEVRRAIVRTGGRAPAEELHALRHDFGAVTLAAAATDVASHLGITVNAPTLVCTLSCLKTGQIC